VYTNIRTGIKKREKQKDNLNIMYKKWFSIIVAALCGFIFLNIAIYAVYPDISKLKKTNPKKTAFMKYREHEWKKKGEKRKIQHHWVSFSNISPYAIKAVIIAEDDNFWRHSGFDLEAMQKALEKDIKKKRFKVGGSTISQQLAKNLYLSPAKNPVRKLKEAILTWRIERNLSKRRIIEIYLNVAEWGDGVFGIEAAARKYYGKPASALSAEEASILASLLPNPRRYRPTGKYVQNRADRIYRIMVRRGIVIPQYEEIMSETETTTGLEELDYLVNTGGIEPGQEEESLIDQEREQNKNPASSEPYGSGIIE
jgi:monofunctional biosynthetic peptidoglycan transglycosylase